MSKDSSRRQPVVSGSGAAMPAAIRPAAAASPTIGICLHLIACSHCPNETVEKPLQRRRQRIAALQKLKKHAHFSELEGAIPMAPQVFRQSQRYALKCELCGAILGRRCLLCSPTPKGSHSSAPGETRGVGNASQRFEAVECESRSHSTLAQFRPQYFSAFPFVQGLRPWLSNSTPLGSLINLVFLSQYSVSA